jgi:hypothetical protein
MGASTSQTSESLPDFVATDESKSPLRKNEEAAA